MMQPDTLQIAEISLFANGYKNAKTIAKKITKLYKICSEILPLEVHYDFGISIDFQTKNRFFNRDGFLNRSSRVENSIARLCQPTFDTAQ